MVEALPIELDDCDGDTFLYEGDLELEDQRCQAVESTSPCARVFHQAGPHLCEREGPLAAQPRGGNHPHSLRAPAASEDSLSNPRNL